MTKHLWKMRGFLENAYKDDFIRIILASILHIKHQLLGLTNSNCFRVLEVGILKGSIAETITEGEERFTLFLVVPETIGKTLLGVHHGVIDNGHQLES